MVFWVHEEGSLVSGLKGEEVELSGDCSYAAILAVTNLLRELEDPRSGPWVGPLASR